MLTRNRSWRFAFLAFLLALGPVLAAIPALPVAAAPLVTQSLAQGKTAQDLVASLIGAGVTFSNVVYTGKDVAAGTVAGGTGVIGFEGGIILSSGNIADVAGPNNSTSKGTSNGTPGDPSLNTLTSGGLTTRDAAVLEFDFVPTASKIYFQYVFASEEYNSFVDTNFNDVFGFFVNGTNCALVNGQPVSINTINRGKDGTDTSRPNANSFINNDKQDGTAPLDTQMDGLTVVLICEANVTQGATSHMKLAIGDTSDGSFDSVVFLKTASFSVTPPSASPSPSGSPGVPVCLSPDSIDFGNQIVGNSAPSELAVLNNCGSEPLPITLAPSLGGTNPGDFSVVSSCAGTTIAVGASCGVRVVFTPAATGPRSAFATVNYPGGSVQVPLTGVGELPHPPFNLTILTVGQCSVTVIGRNGLPDPGPYDVITPVILTPVPAAGWTFIYWKSERGFMGWADPWSFEMNRDHTITAYCVQTPSFSDYTPAGPTKSDPIIRLAALQVIKGYQADVCQERGLAAPCFGPNDQVLRAQMAAFISRGMGRDRPQTWDQEDHGNTFPDKGFIDDALWRNVGTLYFYNVARGFQDGTYQPTGFVLYAQTISFITRAMVFNGYWLQQADNTAVYPNVPANSGHRTDIATYVNQAAAAIPGTNTTSETWPIWNQNATRLWFCLAEWLALNSYFGVGSRFAP